MHSDLDKYSSSLSDSEESKGDINPERSNNSVGEKRPTKKPKQGSLFSTMFPTAEANNPPEHITSKEEFTFNSIDPATPLVQERKEQISSNRYLKSEFPSVKCPKSSGKESMQDQSLARFEIIRSTIKDSHSDSKQLKKDKPKLSPGNNSYVDMESNESSSEEYEEEDSSYAPVPSD